MTSRAEVHITRADALMTRLCGLPPPPEVQPPQLVIDTFRELVDEVEAAALAAEDEDASADLRHRLDRLAKIVLDVGAAGLAAGVVEKVRRGP